jgi:8-oxo-dGTP diphosphatase
VHRDGDGWVQCRCGSKHWGLHGAAGLFLVRDGRALLQHRAPWVHNGDTWGIPGGARDSHETIHEAAIREAKEEIGIIEHLVEPLEIFTDDHGDWRYDTVVARAAQGLEAHEQNDESLDVRWIPLDEIDTYPLHPSFAKTWEELRGVLLRLGF